MHVQPGRARVGDDLRVPVRRGGRDVDVTDLVGGVPDRLADALRALHEELSVP
ncbi:hypothetical protein Ccel01_15530 [Cellulosimicrobium cellulans]|uniref:Uncharacterized protein n=1 Tax=Cellulosimicrobium cellulans TaxID=1710 RepID=A0AAV5P6Y0_CELCE|nr:hypothetical protein Ccel01_15530 [Cellulosimicrobium cellulans]